MTAFLDGERMKEIFQERLPGFTDGRLTISHCVIDEVRCQTDAKYRRRQRPLLCVSYRLDVSPAEDGQHGEQRLYAEVYADGLSRVRSRELLGGQWCPPRFGAPVVHFPELGAIVWAFPNDPALRHLADVIDPGRVKYYLPYEALPAGLDEPADVTAIRADVLRYKPGTHCAARYEIAWESKDGPRVHSVFGKTFKDDRASDVARQLDVVWQKSLDDPKSFLVARPLGWAAPVNMVWQATLAGQPLLPIVDGGHCEDVLERVGTALAVLHETEPVAGITVDVNDQLIEMQKQIAALSELFPSLQAELDALALRLAAQASVLTPVAETLVHGDFIAKNLLAHDGRIVVCDFDDFVIGDPVQDVARFLVDLHFLEDRDSHWVNLRRRDRDAVNAKAAVVLDAYRSRARWKVSDDDLTWHWQVQLIAKIHYYYKRQHLRPGFERDLQDMLALIERDR